MALTWEQFRKAPIRSLPRSALVLPLAVSVSIHAGLVLAVVLVQVGREPREERLTDSPVTETVLTLPTPPAPKPVAPAPPVPEPEPEPASEPDPEPVVASADAMTAPVESPAPVEKAPAPEPAPRVAERAPAPPPPPPPAAPTGPLPVSFAGVEGSRAKRVVYVVDASGAMTSSLKFIKEELERSIARLDASQSFQIVVVREPVEGASYKQVELFTMDRNAGLVPASGQARLRAAAWLESVQPSGRSDPLAGLKAALKLNPDLVFLLTRSIRRSGANAEWGQGTAATLQALNDLNPVSVHTGQRPTVIKAIQFLDEDPTGLLQAIGENHGDGAGSYRVLRVDDLK